MRPGRQFQSNPAALVDVIAEFGHVHQIRFKIRFPAHAEQVNSTAIDGVLDLVFVFQPSHDTKICPEEPDRKKVLAIQGECNFGEDPTDCPDRHALKMDILRGILTNPKRVTAWS